MKQINHKLLQEIIEDCPNRLQTKNSLVSDENCLIAPTLVYILKEVQKELAFQSNGRTLKNSEMDELIYQISERLGYSINSQEKDEIFTYIEKEHQPFGVLQDLVKDVGINDIIVSAYNRIVIQKGRRNYKTGLCFASPEDYEAYVEKLLIKASSSYSTKIPIADGMIGDSARIHAVHKTICDEGPYLTIRLNRYLEIKNDDLISLGLAPREVFDYLTAVVQSGQTLMIAGEVGTGKTTLARAVASEIPSEESILVIEDTPEIKLVHPNVRYIRTRNANLESAGKISPSECIRAGMRMAMNRIIFGEIRDAEAAESFIDVCASGHPGISTVHARNAQDVINRLELFLGRAQKGAAKNVLTQQVGNAIQIVVHISICKQTGKRRIIEVKEIGSFADNVLRTKTIFEYVLEKETPCWLVKNCVSSFKQEIEELERPYNLNKIGNKIFLEQDLRFKEVA